MQCVGEILPVVGRWYCSWCTYQHNSEIARTTRRFLHKLVL